MTLRYGLGVPVLRWRGLHDISAGRGCLVLDGKGDLAEAVLTQITAQRERDLREDHERPVTREELHAARSDIGADRLDVAVISLAEAEVVLADGQQVSSAPALKRLDDLQLVAI